MHRVFTQPQKNQPTHLVAKESGKQQSMMENQTWCSSPEMGSRLFHRPQEPPLFPSFLSSTSRGQQGGPKVCNPRIHYPSSPCHPCCLTSPLSLKTMWGHHARYLYFSCRKQLMIPSHSSTISCSPNTKTVLHIIFQRQQATHSQPLNPFHCDIWNTESSAKSPKLSTSFYTYLGGVVLFHTAASRPKVGKRFSQRAIWQIFQALWAMHSVSQLW